jgi:hypothetical protein
MYNLVKAAEAGWSGNVVDALDSRVVSNLAVRRAGVAALAGSAREPMA